MHSALLGTVSSHPSSCEDNSRLFSEYQLPACVASRLVMSVYFVLNFFRKDARPLYQMVEV